MAQFQIEALAGHDRSAFSCWVEPLDRYFREQVSQDIRRRATACFVAIDEEAFRIAGYYTLSAGSVPLTDLPTDLAKRLPRYPSVPVARLGRLAVDQAYRGRKLGAALLWDAAARAAHSELMAYALLVDAKNDQAEAFYVHHGFAALGSRSANIAIRQKNVWAFGFPLILRLDELKHEGLARIIHEPADLSLARRDTERSFVELRGTLRVSEQTTLGFNSRPISKCRLDFSLRAIPPVGQAFVVWHVHHESFRRRRAREDVKSVCRTLLCAHVAEQLDLEFGFIAAITDVGTERIPEILIRMHLNFAVVDMGLPPLLRIYAAPDEDDTCP